jgi:hypothetical protein
MRCLIEVAKSNCRTDAWIAFLLLLLLDRMFDNIIGTSWLLKYSDKGSAKSTLMPQDRVMIHDFGKYIKMS